MDSSVWATIVGGIMGFLASVLPGVLDIWRQKRGGTTSDSRGSGEGQATDGETSDGGGGGLSDESISVDTRLPYVLLDFLRASVRPVLTYAFFSVFVYIKLLVLYHAMYVDGTKGVELLPLIWDEGTEALFAAVVAFWFGSRTISRSRK